MATSNYPALTDQATQTVYPLRSAESFLVGRNETADLCVLDPRCSRHHFRILKVEGHYYVESLAPHNPTWCNGRPVTKRQPLEHEAVLQAGQSSFQFLLRPPTDSGTRRSAVRPAPASFETIMASAQAPAADAVLDGRPIAVEEGAMLLGREDEAVQVYLPHPQVSRLHARLSVQGKSAVLQDLNSANGTFVNGSRIRGAVTLRRGDQIDIGPYALQFTGTALVPRARSDNAELIARGVRRVVTSRDTGKPLTLLDDITLVIRPREFVCLLGPSGSGKSTLLSALSGRAPADEGSVQFNGKDLYANFDALKQDMAVVPQKDVLHEALAVGQALWYTARLRLPPDTSGDEIETCLSGMLETVGLTARRGTTIRYLSGGQVKRASLANEILCKPSLLFLDEVTSGLDEQTDREMMNLFRSLADAGKTVVCITHSLANVERTCHLVVILTAGGKLAFVGKPSEALQYFRIDRLGDVYDRLAEQPAEHWQQAFLGSPLYKRYVEERLPADTGPEPAAAAPPSGRHDRIRLYFRQAVLMTRRYFAVWVADYPSLLAMAGQALLVAVLLCVLFGDLSKKATKHNTAGPAPPPAQAPANAAQREAMEKATREAKEEAKAAADDAKRAANTVNLLLLLAVSSFWFGCNNAAKEIVKERTIYTRERDFNLLVGSYYTSKLLLLATFSCLQVAILYVIVRAWCGVQVQPLIGMAVLLLLALAGVTLGLAISAFSKTEEMAITLIPMAVIPQIILSGVIAPLSGVSKALALVGITTYWGNRALEGDGCLSETLAAAVHPEALDQNSPWAAMLVLVLHALAGIVVALGLLYWQGRRGRGLAFLLRRPAPR
jgi:ABC-type multidrug transport system ATPase subunit/ABC-type multidrug transport system permease subunit